MIRTYSELVKLETFDDRFRYLQLNGEVGKDTFGFDRFLNQDFYRSKEWKRARDLVIARDLGCDLGVEGFEIHGKLMIHHMNPITPKDIMEFTDYLVDPEYLVCVSYDTHNALHFGDDSILEANKLITRKPNDTCPWKV